MATLAPAPTAPRRRVQPLLWRAQSLLASYVPLLLMAVLAAFTWWLIKSTPQLEAPRERAAPKHEPDYRMQGFELERFTSDGRLMARVLGRELRHYPDNDTMEIDAPELRAYGLQGELLIAQAKRGLSNGDGSEVQLLGDVKLHRYPDGDPAAASDLALYGEFLHAFVPQQKMRSHLPTRVVGLGGEMQLRSFDYDNLTGKLSFTGGGRAQFSAQPTHPPSGAKAAAAPGRAASAVR
ncbi:LPS export ABC transporter periplasmic protein LptC [Roseateles amylovorans]|uniref:LPS export ABC transporter periplasmic protein LptC n=1 Tax=Roseateles amylovorans TaxID=2978473 RepID=A0ABY6B072_9BURK|nr:LPS export ABC transporter periplasmic protein LptC [Roseateles amylovorans]UXH78347.1 LPS export ABC transporter periplasmic protein LptC [Roseateles amylovorans]